jgi:hypothetical protein
LLVVIARRVPRNKAELAKPSHQFRETLAIFPTDGREFQAQSTTGMDVADNRFGPDLSFFHKKINVGLRAYGF